MWKLYVNLELREIFRVFANFCTICMLFAQTIEKLCNYFHLTYFHFNYDFSDYSVKKHTKPLLYVFCMIIMFYFLLSSFLANCTKFLVFCVFFWIHFPGAVSSIFICSFSIELKLKFLRSDISHHKGQFTFYYFR